MTVAALAIVSNAATNQLQQLFNFSSNPTNVGIYLYCPMNVAASPALIVAMHYCGGMAQAYFMGTQYANLVDQRSFLVIYHDAPDSSSCWDVHTNATLTHNAGGDFLGIVSAVCYAILTYNIDPNRVFAYGTMMTNILAGAYPDVFGDLVRTGYPAYSSTCPKMQIWLGTLDATLNYNNTSTPTSSSTTVTTMTTTTPGTQQTYYGQCGGMYWTGPTACEPPYTCQFSNDYYSKVCFFIIVS
ncbi:putative acetylxylan esterase A [Termitomyces sp. J132]|nr:putative acetylxylan esterase A [Termitomyces sp. J132]